MGLSGFVSVVKVDGRVLCRRPFPYMRAGLHFCRPACFIPCCQVWWCYKATKALPSPPSPNKKDPPATTLKCASNMFVDVCMLPNKELIYIGLVYTVVHEVGPWKMVFTYGPTSMVRFFIFFKLKKSTCKAYGPLARCKQNVGQDEWPCTQKVKMLIFLNICPKWAVLKNKNKIKFDYSLCFLLSSSSLPPKKFIILLL